MATKCTVERDWNNDGMLKILNDETLDHYNELQKERYEKKHEGIFWAFSKEQFDKGLEKIKPYREEGDKIVSFCGGGFGTPKAIKKMMEWHDEIDKRIAAECDPQEVYYYEYNNHESCINYEGDTEAIKIIIDYWGPDIARKITRYSKIMTVDQLLLGKIEVGKLVFNDDQTPSHIWFEEKDGKAWTMSESKLYPVYDANNHQFEAKDKTWWGLTAWYDNGILRNWHKD